MIDNNKKVSVLLSVFNNIDTVEEAIHSILNQSYSNIELLITDDFSDDSSYDICKLISKKIIESSCFETIQIWVNQDLNIMLNASTGYYIARQDADDISYLERIEKQIEALEKNNFDVIYTRAIKKESNRLIPGFSYYLPLKILSRYKNPCVHGTLLTKKKNIFDVGCYDESFYYAQDYKLLNSFLNKKMKIKILSDPYYVLNTKNNISSNFKKEQKYYADCVRKKESQL